MPTYFIVLALAVLPAVANFVGGVLAELVPTSRRTLNRALHVASGIVVAVVGVELLPEALGGAAAPWLIAVSLLLGGLCYVLIDAGIDRLRGSANAAGAWIIYAAIAIDLFSDGLMIGVGSVVSFSLALVLAVGQASADVPEGFATIAVLKDNGVARARRLLLCASFVLASVVGATAGYWLLRGQSDVVQRMALSFSAGLLLLAATEDMLREAHDAAADTRVSALLFIGGFAFFVVVSSYFHG